HGVGGSSMSEGDYWHKTADLGWRVTILQSSQLIAPGRYHWQDAAKAMDELRQHPAEIGEAPFTVLAGLLHGGGPGYSDSREQIGGFSFSRTKHSHGTDGTVGWQCSPRR